MKPILVFPAPLALETPKLFFLKAIRMRAFKKQFLQWDLLRVYLGTCVHEISLIK
jgi:hypothetical protein